MSKIHGADLGILVVLPERVLQHTAFPVRGSKEGRTDRRTDGRKDRQLRTRKLFFFRQTAPEDMARKTYFQRVLGSLCKEGRGQASVGVFLQLLPEEKYCVGITECQRVENCICINARYTAIRSIYI